MLPTASNQNYHINKCKHNAISLVHCLQWFILQHNLISLFFGESMNQGAAVESALGESVGKFLNCQH
jgi:hypothetical protein